MKPVLKRIGIFGGSFDPVHEGHLHLAKLAKNAIRLDEVWFLPCEISPHKTGAPPTDAARRTDWLHAALKAIPWARVDTIDLESEGASYSYRTLQKLVARHPENEWFWIMGGDQWTAFERWKHPEIISELAEFIVLARDGSEVQPRAGARLHIVEGEHPASSTKIREGLAAGLEKIPYLPESVAELLKS